MPDMACAVDARHHQTRKGVALVYCMIHCCASICLTCSRRFHGSTCLQVVGIECHADYHDGATFGRLMEGLEKLKGFKGVQTHLAQSSGPPPPQSLQDAFSSWIDPAQAQVRFGGPASDNVAGTGSGAGKEQTARAPARGMKALNHIKVVVAAMDDSIYAKAYLAIGAV